MVGEGSGYNITHTHYRDIYGRLLWVEPLQEEYRLFQPKETFFWDDIQYCVERIAVVENTQHVNVVVVVESLNVVEPYL